MSKPRGWFVNAVIGQPVVNPIIFVYDIVKKNKAANTVNKSNIGELIAACLKEVPHRPQRVLEIIAENFPELKEEIEKYWVLI